MRRPAVRAIAVIVPAHDEQELLPRCLDSVDRAAAEARACGVDVSVWMVLDACTDGSEEVAARHPGRLVRIDATCVGAARTAGVSAALRAHADVSLERLWTAHTDADSVVPPHWLTHQLDLARVADVVVGTVRPEAVDLTAEQLAAWRSMHVPGRANGHVHGANLGVRASDLVAAGGFPPLREHEDVGLVDALRDAGARIVASDEAWVLTSGRQQGRTGGGYARYLREDLVRLAADAGAAS